MRVWVRVHRHWDGNVIIAIADEELMGKEFSEGIKVLKVNEFYKGELVSIEEASRIVEEATIINAVGERSVEMLISKGLVHPESVKRIKGIPYAQSFLM